MFIPHHQRPYQPTTNFQDQLLIAVKAVKAVYQIQEGPFDLKVEVRKKVFWAMVWMLTESSGKYGTRYRSTAALSESADNVRHEHVFPIAHLYYLSRHGLSVFDALSLSCGCLVTKNEHDRLSHRDKLPDPPFGWKRYEVARIEVTDMQENRVLCAEEMEHQTLPFATAMDQAHCCGDGEVDLELERRDRLSSERSVCKDPKIN